MNHLTNLSFISRFIIITFVHDHRLALYGPIYPPLSIPTYETYVPFDGALYVDDSVWMVCETHLLPKANLVRVEDNDNAWVGLWCKTN